MSAQNCTEMAECYLFSAFDTYYNSNNFADKIGKTLLVSAETFRGFGIAYNIISTVVCYGVHASKIRPVGSDGVVVIDDDSKRKLIALFYEKSVALSSILVVGFELFYLIPMSKYYTPDISWTLFQGQTRMVEYKYCLGYEYPVPNFNNKFQEVASSLIQVNNHFLNRVAAVVGGTTLGISTLMAIQLVASCLLQQKFSKRDAVSLAFIVVGFAFGIFGAVKSHAIDVGPDLKEGWKCCSNETLRLA